jgi:hypothetical protein
VNIVVSTPISPSQSAAAVSADFTRNIADNSAGTWLAVTRSLLVEQGMTPTDSVTLLSAAEDTTNNGGVTTTAAPSSSNLLGGFCSRDEWQRCAAIIGGVVGGVVLLVFIFVMHRRRKGAVTLDAFINASEGARANPYDAPAVHAGPLIGGPTHFTFIPGAAERAAFGGGDEGDGGGADVDSYLAALADESAAGGVEMNEAGPSHMHPHTRQQQQHRGEARRTSNFSANDLWSMDRDLAALEGHHAREADL